MNSTQRWCAAGALTLTLAGCSGKVAGSDAGTPPPPSCAAICPRLLQTSCSIQAMTESECEKSCNDAVAMAQKVACGADFDAVLSCFETATLRCTTNGDLDPSICAPQTAALGLCQNPPRQAPAGCEGIPSPASGARGCSGAGAAPGQPIIETCSDGSGHMWTATCTGSTCSCAYDGKTFCSCQDDGGPGCCPGTS